jgi:hypothetical protein
LVQIAGNEEVLSILIKGMNQEFMVLSGSKFLIDISNDIFHILIKVSKLNLIHIMRRVKVLPWL